MSRIYNEGYRRGFGDGQQQTRPERDWTPANGSSAEVGSDVERLELILNAAAEARDGGLLSEWEITFSDSMRTRLERFGQRMFVSVKQWASLDRLEIK
jgi:hypothetical protein